ncbi:MAG: class I SAM-dependent methyltransferase [Magnetococcales bacterium]|nr:class I SAM-dependent methyltransferase [Magnetococcales bacterium]
MSFEAIRLQSWYATAQGQTVTRLVGKVLRRWLSLHKPETCLGYGFSQPYLSQIQAMGSQVWGASPAEMGVASWPRGEDNRIALVRPEALPFADESFDQVIMTHLLEGTQSPRVALRETWRILKPGCRLFIMVPNRGGVWARRDGTPFGWGRPFSPRQLKEQLEDSFFIPRQSCFALFMPPFSSNWLLKAAGAWEKAGTRWCAPLGGVIVCEAEKVVYASTPLARDFVGVRSREGMVLPVAKNQGSRGLDRRRL